ncbi:neurogenic protein big brain [Ischnura elegans]|uniref:neurogenic protein big brain n=1 Tax=Ischnura elegans TaxID=197161 RepID=UPI001ED8BFBA|nr:neurogenic protein big brain [Ischnura elegans]
MASTSLTNQNVECHILTLFEKLEAMRRDAAVSSSRLPMQVEVRTLEFWRSIISECLATFFYVFIACGGGASMAGPGATAASQNLGAALATGFAVATLTQCFGHVSGAHMNPAVTVAMATTRNISLLRAAMFVTAQCGGGIAGAALLYGVTLPGYPGIAGTTSSAVGAGGSSNPALLLQQLAPPPSPVHLTAWERFGVDFILSFIVVFTYFVCMADCNGGCGGGGGASWGGGGSSSWWGGGFSAHRRWLQGQAALPIGAAYLSCSLVAIPSLNPARSLGPAFVTNKWENHWVYWFGPILGGVVSGLIYEFIFNPKRQNKRPKDSIDGDSSSINSDEDPYDEVGDKGTVAAPTVVSSASAMAKFHQHQQLHQSQGHLHQSNHAQQNHHNSHLANQGGYMGHQSYQTLRPGAGDVTMRAHEPHSPTGNGALTMTSLNPSPPIKLDRIESIYGGTKSLYTKSPPLTRANLNRSQSVYSKTPPQGVNRNAGFSPRPGPLVPAQSLYPMRTGEGMVANGGNSGMMMNPRSESIYGVRSVANMGGGGVYGTTSAKSNQGNNGPSGRQDSVYAPTARRQDSTDSSYGSYQSNGVYGKTRGDSQPRHMQQQSHQHHSPVPHLMVGGNHPPPSSTSSGPNSMLNTPNSVSSCRHLSPSPQY